MSFFKFPLAATLFLALVLPTFVQAQTTALSEKEKIEALINLVSQLKTAKFVRNGWTYSADTAASPRLARPAAPRTDPHRDDR